MLSENNDFKLDIKWPFSNKKHNFFVIILLFLMLIVTYSNSFDCSWHFDDYDNITRNEKVHLKEFSWNEIEKSFYGIIGTNKWSRPLSYFSFAVNYYFHGLDVFGYHVVNFAVHYLSAFFLFLFIYETLGLPVLEGRYGHNRYSIALLSAVLWAINPLQVTAVTYIVQRMASMAAMFYIMSMYFYLKGRVDSGSWKKIIFYTFCLLFAVLAVASKENAAMLPVTIFIFDLFLIQGITKKTLKRSFLVFLFSIAIVLGAGIFFHGNISSIIGDYSVRPFTMLERLLTEPRVILFYITLLLYPITSRLMFIHDIEVSTTLFNPLTTFGSIVTILVIVGTAVWAARKRPLISFCIIFFFINHLIEGSFISLELIFEHRNYLPSMLFFLPIAMMIIKGLGYFSHRKKMFIILTLAITIFIVLQGVTVFIQNNILKDEVSLWSHNVEKAPYLHHARQNLAAAYMEARLFSDSLRELEKALECKLSANITKKCVTHLCMGENYFLGGNNEKALEHYQAGLKIDPYYRCHDQTYNRIAQIMTEKDSIDTAETMIKKALNLNSGKPGFYVTYGYILIKKECFDDAIQMAQKALRLKGFPPQAYMVIAKAFEGKNNTRMANHFYKLCNIK